jgi:hypothetical protein
MSSQSDEGRIIKRAMESWVDEIMHIVDTMNTDLKDVDSIDAGGDRMEKIAKIYFLLSKIEKVVNDFKTWLRYPSVQVFITDEMLSELFTEFQQVAHRMLAIDIDHTSKFAEHVIKHTGEHIPALRLIRRIELEKQGIQPEQIQQQQQQQQEGGTPMYV